MQKNVNFAKVWKVKYLNKGVYMVDVAIVVEGQAVHLHIHSVLGFLHATYLDDLGVPMSETLGTVFKWGPLSSAKGIRF